MNNIPTDTVSKLVQEKLAADFEHMLDCITDSPHYSQLQKVSEHALASLVSSSIEDPSTWDWYRTIEFRHPTLKHVYEHIHAFAVAWDPADALNSLEIDGVEIGEDNVDWDEVTWSYAAVQRMFDVLVPSNPFALGDVVEQLEIMHDPETNVD
jgi:hypothetical protein